MASTLFTALNAVATATVGTAVFLGRPMPIHSMQVHHTGAPTIKVNLEGSLNGTDFDALVLWDSTVQSNHDIVTASAFAGTSIKAYPVVAWVRANCTDFTGGTNPTVTAEIASFGA